MDTAPFHELLEEDRKLTVGAKVTARWTHQGYLCRGRGEIISCGPRSVKVKLLKQDAAFGLAPDGNTLTLPRFSDQQVWSLDNCVRLDRSPRSRDLHLPPGSLRG